jgi:hypothetical protein
VIVIEGARLEGEGHRDSLLGSDRVDEHQNPNENPAAFYAQGVSPHLINNA